MSRLIALMVVACVAIPMAALAAAPAEEAVQGLYEGVRTDAAGAHKFEARVAACGKGEFKVFLREQAGEGKVNKAELDGKTAGDAVAFQGKVGEDNWSATYADGAIKGDCGKAGKLEMKRVERPNPALGVKPPQGAILLLDAKNFQEMNVGKTKDGKEQEWKVLEDGGVLIPKGGMNTKRRLEGSFKLHVEFKIPFVPAGRSQGRGNSGVYLPNGDEIQVLDSFGMTTYLGGGCGGLYKYKDPDVFDTFSLASLPPLVWQAYDVEYTVTKKDGKPAGKPTVTVYHNGIKIHDKFQLERDAKPGGFSFQDHGNPVQYRNIWVLPIEEK